MLLSPLAHQTIGAAEEDFNISEETEDACPSEGPQLAAPFHLHRSDDEAFYILAGRLAFRVGDDEIFAPPGACILIPKGTPHTYWNPDPVPARYLLVMTPRLRQLVDEFDTDPERPEDEMRLMYERYDSELVKGSGV